MISHSELQVSAARRSREQEMMACFSALDRDSQDFILGMASRRRRALERMMQETGLDRDSAGAGYDVWIRAKTDAMLAQEK